VMSCRYDDTAAAESSVDGNTVTLAERVRG
jgi:hypothetical protein